MNTLKIPILALYTEQYRNSFFNKTILEWNHLEENIVSATSVEAFGQVIFWLDSWDQPLNHLVQKY
jgi:hypothetical protein